MHRVQLGFCNSDCSDTSLVFSIVQECEADQVFPARSVGVILKAICTTFFDFVLPNKLGSLSISGAYVSEGGVVVIWPFPFSVGRWRSLSSVPGRDG